MVDPRRLKRADIPLLVLTYALAGAGVVLVFTAAGPGQTMQSLRQVAWIALGTATLVAAALIDYRLHARTAWYFYGLCLVVLGLVIFPRVGHEANGAARWIAIGGFRFQPSEFAKVIVILTLATFLSARRSQIGSPGTLALSLVIVLVPAILVIKQPDLGTAGVLIAVWGVMVWMAGARLSHLALIAAAGCVLCVGAWRSGHIIRTYQKNRLIAFVNPEADPQDTGYHILQARMAIGSGGVWGRGPARAGQVHGGFIPERQTDFIFTVASEEFGFVGAVAVVALYGLLLLRGAAVLVDSRGEPFGLLVASGVLAMIGVHATVNMGMNVGILPVTGVPLPLLSAGGSNIVATLISIGLLESVRMYSHTLVF